MSLYDDIAETGVYFIFSQKPNLFAHLSICLAEGLTALGIPVFANRPYWLTGCNPDTYLFDWDKAVSPADVAVCVVDISGQEADVVRSLLQPALTTPSLRVILNNSDFELWLPEFNEFSYIFRSHMVGGLTYPSNYIPWAFGISNRIQMATYSEQLFAERKQECLVNFRPSFSQSVRVALEFLLMPWLETMFTLNRTVEEAEAKPVNIEADPFHYLYWRQLGGRHHPRYYERLKTAMLCCTYGGNFVYLEQGGPGVARWDSWRFWESFAAGCATLHLDLEKYGLLLPVMPKNWVHYIGVDLANPKAVVERLQDEPTCLSRIAAEGKAWALEHYQPRAIASYFLDILVGEPLGTTQMLLATVDALAEVD